MPIAKQIFSAVRFFGSMNLKSLPLQSGLPLLDTFCNKLTEPRSFFNDTLILGVQHRLKSTSLFAKQLSDMGAHLFIAGKTYSDVPDILSVMQEIP
ncbi:MAG: hypothetical protein ACK4PR_14285, partial [Gammaproteobacteria bacterium]